MIRPTKYMDLNASVLNVAAEVLTELQRFGAIPLPELSETIASRVGASAKYNFFPALSLLYMTGKIEYDADVDAIVYLLKRAERAR